MLRKLLTAAIILLLNNANAQNAAKSISIEIIDNDLFVEAFVNGMGPFNFVVDTGASGIGRLDDRIVKELGLVAVDSTKNYDGSGKYQMVPVLRVSALQIGGIEIENAELFSRNYNANPKKGDVLTDGIIGRDFFADYLLTIDGPGRKIICSADSLSPNVAGVIRYDVPFQIQGKIRNEALMFNIDTGSNLSMHIPKTVMDLFRHADTGKQSIARKANSEYLIKETVLKESIHISAAKAIDTEVYYSEPATYINVGMRFLKNYKITIDQKHKLFKLE